MKHSIHINQKQAMDLGIKNLVQGHIFDLLTGASTWASPEVVDGEVYYWVSRQRISEQLPLADLKPDTIYRNLKKLAEIGLIEYIKVGKKDCMRLTKIGRSYYVGSKSELDKNTMSDLNPNNAENSDLNPEKLGSKSEKHSDLNPTYKSVNNISPISDKSKEKTSAKKFKPPTSDEVNQFATANNLNLNGFYEYYCSNGWKVGGRAPMVDWHMAAHGWHKRSKQFAGNHKPANDFTNKDYSLGTEGFITNG
ncbi:MAG: hypothetical protein Tp185DCM00d2C31949971_58 [Prokaryotic dsDNA virus sp.]|uniref:hypothetical protein n=1 Tax=Gammaproteobacteria TaxID=1236 RepID=UPI000EE77F40|nr:MULTISPECIES: hypothetical protein [Gammaproteobacteria]QDP60942.1 MAG: hypothetical protein Tp185DCM00d2C31949971_58 [Prokaryotic dsDNA virus sp.]QDP61789.1 MAG: hypothetical protein Tp1111MES1053591_28 [Prokaryotic dsDNA virus sp.]HCC80403.1 hypothetical protein [Methylophaga sp.]|tara:strand:+ start:4118 stop:4870 length:753 start_codon:yes stop_codon:yes gene_type:complete